jgi:hypothetical protein
MVIAALFPSDSGTQAALSFLPPSFNALIGAACMLVGHAAIFARKHIAVRRCEFGCSVSTWWQLGRPWQRRDKTMVGLERVTVGKQTMRMAEGTSVMYPITIEGTGRKIVLGRPDCEATARRVAEEIAAFLDVNVLDERSGLTLCCSSKPPEDAVDESPSEPPSPQSVSYNVDRAEVSAAFRDLHRASEPNSR